MPKGIILRIPAHLENKLPAELLAALKKQFPDHVVEFYSAKPDYKASYVARVDILYQAFEYLLAAYPLSKKVLISKETLKSYAKECKDASNSGEESIAKLQERLAQFTADIIDAVAIGWERSAEHATELLNEAEQYVVMAQGRADLVTLTDINLGEGVKYVLQREEVLPPYDQLVLKELQQIKSFNYPKTPAWLRELAKPENHFKHAYFCNFPGTLDEIKDDLKGLSKAWQALKDSPQINMDLKDVAQNSSPLPPWFEKLSLPHQEVIRCLASHSAATINDTLNIFSKTFMEQLHQENFSQIVKIPQWYWTLPEHQQYFLEHALKNKPTIEEAVSYLSSRHRTLPLSANFCRHSFYAITAENQCKLLYGPKYRSSHVATRDGAKLEWPKAVLKRYCKANLELVISYAREDQLVLQQTLISPIGSEYMPEIGQKYIDEHIPDYGLNKMVDEIIRERTTKPHVIKTNHPYNIANLVLYSKSTNKDIKLFLDSMEPYAAVSEETQTLLKLYKSVLASNIYARELVLSSIEHLLIDSIDGYSCGSCVSGKDRKALEIIHTDAIYLYKEKYGVWPQFVNPSDSERANFVELVADLYMTWHHHRHAGQNAPGSEGIKTPSKYYPKDIAKEIERRLANSLKTDDILATNNEVRKISTGNSYNDEKKLTASQALICKLTAKELGEEGCTRLYDALYTLIFGNTKKFIPWTLVYTASLPTGIKQIQKLMTDKNSGSDNVTRLEKIFAIVLTRPEDGALGNSYKPKRTEATLSVYNCINQLLGISEKKGQVIPLLTLVDMALTQWDKLCAQSDNESQLSLAQ